MDKNKSLREKKKKKYLKSEWITKREKLAETRND